MAWAVFSLIKGRNGRSASRFSVATISTDPEGKVVIDCPNREMRARLEEHFSSAVQVRVPVAKPPHFFSYGWQQLQPGEDRHLREKLYRLHWLDLVAVEVGADRQK